MVVCLKSSSQDPSTEGTAAAATGGSSAAEPGQPADEPYKDWSGLFVKFELVFTDHFSVDDIENINQYFREVNNIIWDVYIAENSNMYCKTNTEWVTWLECHERVYVKPGMNVCVCASVLCV